MVKSILVDTSVWITYYRKDETVFAEINQLAEDERVRLTGLILAELHQGCKTQKEMTVISDMADVFPSLPEPADCWVKAGKLANKLRKKGQTIGLADCYLAIIAKEAGALIYSFDKHFEVIAKTYGLELYQP